MFRKDSESTTLKEVEEQVLAQENLQVRSTPLPIPQSHQQRDPLTVSTIYRLNQEKKQVKLTKRVTLEMMGEETRAMEVKARHCSR